MPMQYPRELRERAVRLVAEHRDQYETEYAAIRSIAAKLGIGSAESLRKWVRQAEVDGGQRPGVSSEESAEIRRLRRGNAELRRANEILKAASAFWRQVTQYLDSCGWPGCRTNLGLRGYRDTAIRPQRARCPSAIESSTCRHYLLAAHPLITAGSG